LRTKQRNSHQSLFIEAFDVLEGYMAKSKVERWLEQEGLILIEGWARDGLTEKDIAHNMGVSNTTLTDYKNKYPAILNALKKGKEVADYTVENALYRSALEGNTTAQIFWLKNRRPDKWRDKPREAAQSESEEFNKLIDVIIGERKNETGKI
jgi:hypothetical protein